MVMYGANTRMSIIIHSVFSPALQHVRDNCLKLESYEPVLTSTKISDTGRDSDDRHRYEYNLCSGSSETEIQ